MVSVWPAGTLKPKYCSGQLFHEGIHLDRLEPDLREVHPEDRRDVAPAEADQADLLRVRPEEEAGEHHRGVLEDGGVRLLEIDAGLAQVALAAEDHAPLHAVLADGDMVVDGVALVKGLLVRGGLRRQAGKSQKQARRMTPIAMPASHETSAFHGPGSG